MRKIVQLVYSLESGGRAGLRLHNSFIESGLSSAVLSLQYGAAENGDIHFLNSRNRLISRIDGKIQSHLKRKALKEWGLFSYPVLGSDLSKNKHLLEADVIYLHWVLGGMLNLSGIEKLAGLGKPVFIFLHDMWMITGGCHHSFSCQKYIQECSACPVFRSANKKDLAFSLFRKKQKLFAKFNNLFFVSPSKWLLECAKQSMLTKNKPVFHIPNILSEKVFRPFEKNVAKQILNIGPNERVLLFGATGLSSPYKGWSYLREALNLLNNDVGFEPVTLLVFGGGQDAKISEQVPFKVRYLGYLKDELSLNIVYNAADVFVAPSVAEAFGYVVMESLSCGTPVVAFGVGGITDQINHLKNGYIAAPANAYDLAKGIKYCFQNQIKGSLLQGFDSQSIMLQHIKLIDFALHNKPT